MKDHDKIARHLNKLLERAAPFTISKDAVIKGGTKETAKELYERLKPIFEAALPEVDDAEIAQAATDKRPAELCRPDMGTHWWGKPIPWHGTKVLWLHCLPKLKAVIKAFNQERKEEYEQYRQACMEGTAVAPEEKEEEKQ